MHTHVGNLLFHDVVPYVLSKDGILFYSHNYVVPKEEGKFGCLEEISLPLLSSKKWPMLDPWTMISLKTKMANDILASLEYNQASRLVCLHLACPIHVFSQMFHAMKCKETLTMYA